MFIGRKDERKNLESIYSAKENNFLMVYGREGIGKTTLVLKFCENKPYVYYCALDTTPFSQERGFNKAVSELEELKTDDKRVLVIDEFSYFSDQQLNERLISLRERDDFGLMIILICNSVNWVENRMVNEAKNLAKAISDVMKVKEMSFRETVEWFPKMSVDDAVLMRSVVGGVPKYMKLWQDNRRVRENVVSLLMTKGCPLENECQFFLKLELRELSAYNAILHSLATGKYKLNDIYSETGFSRAKISVYLKNLIEMDIVEKIFPANVRKAENTQKGLYRMTDNLLRFYYAYVFPNLDQIELGKGKQAFDKYFMNDMERFVRESFADVAKEFLMIMSKRNALKHKYSEYRTWIGKTGILDIVATDNEHNFLAAMCLYSEAKTDIEDIDNMKEIVTDAGLRCDDLCIFSRAGFTDRALKEAKELGIMAVAMSDL